MSNALIIKLQASKTYLILTLCVYALSAFAVWYYAHYLWLSVMISLVLLVSLYRFLPTTVLCIRPKSISQITLNKHHISLQKNDKSTQQYTHFNAVYQSRFLVIIALKKQSLVIFKDSLNSQSLSTINRFLNART